MVNTKKSGMTLVEVMVATVIIGIMTVAGGSYFTYAAKLRMRSRALQAASFEANSLMEAAYGTLDESLYNQIPAGGEAFLSSDMTWSNTDPKDTWEFDGADYPVQIVYERAPLSTADAPAVIVTVKVSYMEGKEVNLRVYRYCGEG